jgi:acyl-coenzyme A synthetase/AMP-(fatty) acid ligase
LASILLGLCRNLVIDERKNLPGEDQELFDTYIKHRVISRHQNRILTYGQLDRDSNALARGLSKKGVKKGDRCAVMLGNNVEFATVRKSFGIGLRK